MNAITSSAMKAMVFAATGMSISGCAPVLALAPLAAGVSLIALDDKSKAQTATAPEEPVQYSEALAAPPVR